MKKIKQYSGNRTKTGYHTGYSILKLKGVYYISTESGTRKATKKEINDNKIR